MASPHKMTAFVVVSKYTRVPNGARNRIQVLISHYKGRSRGSGGVVKFIFDEHYIEYRTWPLLPF